MSKRLQVKQKVNNSKESAQDCVVFMTAYNINKFNKKLSFFQKRDKLLDLLSECHISSLVSQNFMLTQKGRLKYSTKFNSHKQTTEFHFDVCKKEDKIENYSEEINQVSWFLLLNHSMELLLDRTMFEISFFINMERFLVSVDSQLLQVDPIVFFFNGMVFINFELINYDTGVPLKKDSIYGRDNNYNIIPVDGMQYFNGKELVTDTRRIPNIIFENVCDFFERVTRYKFQIDNFSYVHNLFVISNSIKNMDAYFLNVLGAEGLEIELKSINSSNAYQYYSQEYLGVVTSVSEKNRKQALFDCQLLEVLKMYFSLNQIINFEITEKLDETINNQIRIDRLSFVSKTPIITLSAIANMKKTESFKRYKDAIDFKISYLSLLQERKKNKNALLMNILIYILTFIGGIGTLQVLQTELGWSFKICAVILGVIFIGLGVFWVLQERKK